MGPIESLILFPANYQLAIVSPMHQHHSMVYDTVSVSWTRLFHTIEYAEYDQRAVNSEDGPLIFLPTLRAGTTAFPFAPRLPANTFDSLNDLHTYLYMNREVLDHEFRIGLSKPLLAEEKKIVRPALLLLIEWFNAENERYFPQTLPFDDIALQNPSNIQYYHSECPGEKPDCPVLIQNVGNYGPVIRTYEWMSKNILITS